MDAFLARAGGWLPLGVLETFVTEEIAKNRSECVFCQFAIFSHIDDIANLTNQLGINADWSLSPAVPTFDSKGVAQNSGRRGCWLIRSKDHIESKDVNEHLRYLLGVLLPHREKITAASRDGVTVFTIHWAGQAYPYECGPAIAVDCVAGIATLEAEIAFTLHSV